MARLRIRIELNRGGVGVPLHKLASVVVEAQKFFHLLGQDVHIDKNRGEWLGFDFDHESLNFTAEFVGPVTQEQVSAFNMAFDGTTPLRRTTIAQFARITDAIGEDELIGFGLYQTDEGNDPTEWRCLSRRDALRISEEIQVLIGEGEPPDPESHLPAVTDSGIGARLFSERRERTADAEKLAALVHEMEASLSQRIGRVESEIEHHSVAIQDLRSKSASAEDSMRSLLAAVESFCSQAARQIESFTPAALPAPAAPPPPQPLMFAAAEVAAPAAPPAPRTPVGNHGDLSRWTIAAGAVAVVLVSCLLLLWSGRSGGESAHAETVATPVSPVVPPVAATSVAPAATPVPPSAPIVAPTASASHVTLTASEPTWVSLTGADGTRMISRLFTAGETTNVDLPKAATLRVGNAAGIAVSFNGNPVGPVGPRGMVRDIRFQNGTFKIVAPVEAK